MEINELLNEVLSAERRAAEIASEAKSNAREIVMKAESDAKQYIAKAKEEKTRPTMILLHTVKSYGYIPGEGIKANHSMPVSKEKAEEAIAALLEREGGKA